MPKMKTGTAVGARRWPRWGTPWKGVLLSKDDPRAWLNVLGFQATRAAIRKYHRENPRLFKGQIPVLWEFGPTGLKVYWEDTAALRPFEKDLADWERAQEAERAERTRRAAA